MIRSTPGCSSDGNWTPQSMTTMSSVVSHDDHVLPDLGGPTEGDDLQPCWVPSYARGLCPSMGFGEAPLPPIPGGSVSNGWSPSRGGCSGGCLVFMIPVFGVLGVGCWVLGVGWTWWTRVDAGGGLGCRLTLGLRRLRTRGLGGAYPPRRFCLAWAQRAGRVHKSTARRGRIPQVGWRMG